MPGYTLVGTGVEAGSPLIGGNVKREPRTAPKSKQESNGASNGAARPKKVLLPRIQVLVRKICRNDHRKGILAR